MDKQRLLIIEDNEEVRENLAEILEIYGYITVTAKNGLEGVKACIQDPPDMVLCDIMMPELDGYGVLNLLSENERTAGIPFIFITAKTETEDIRRGMNLGADDYITKPFYKDELLQVIRTRLKKAALRNKAANSAPKKQVHLATRNGVQQSWPKFSILPAVKILSPRSSRSFGKENSLILSTMSLVATFT